MSTQNKQDDVIYTLFRMEDGEKKHFYVGITTHKGFERRKNEHFTNLREHYVQDCEGGKKGDLKVGEYYEISQLAEYKFAREHILPKGLEVEMEEYVRVLEADGSEDTEAAVAMKLIREGHELHQDERKLVYWNRLAQDKYAKATPTGVMQARQKAEEDKLGTTDKFIKQIAARKRVARQVVQELTRSGWKKGQKEIMVRGTAVIFTRETTGKHGSNSHQVSCVRKDGETLRGNVRITSVDWNYLGAYERLAILVVSSVGEK